MAHASERGPVKGEEQTRLVPIGYISKAHGIRGELVFALTADDPGLVSGTLFLRHKNGGPLKEYALLASRVHHGSLLLRLHGVDDRTLAEALRSHTVFVSRDRLPDLAEGEVLLADLPGLKVLLATEGDPKPLGVIEKAEAPAGQVLWSIRTPEGREVLFPAVEDFVLSIDLDEGRAVIDPPPGLLDLYLGE